MHRDVVASGGNRTRISSLLLVGMGVGGLLTFMFTCTLSSCYVTKIFSCTCQLSSCYINKIFSCTCQIYSCYINTSSLAFANYIQATLAIYSLALANYLHATFATSSLALTNYLHRNAAQICEAHIIVITLRSPSQIQNMVQPSCNNSMPTSPIQ